MIKKKKTMQTSLSVYIIVVKKAKKDFFFLFITLCLQDLWEGGELSTDIRQHGWLIPSENVTECKVSNQNGTVEYKGAFRV